LDFPAVAAVTPLKAHPAGTGIPGFYKIERKCLPGKSSYQVYSGEGAGKYRRAAGYGRKIREE